MAIAENGRRGEVRYLGEVEASEAATRKLVVKLAARHGRLTFAYEAGPTGYGLCRLIESLGHTCIVAAPSAIKPLLGKSSAPRLHGRALAMSPDAEHRARSATNGLRRS